MREFEVLQFVKTGQPYSNDGSTIVYRARDCLQPNPFSCLLWYFHQFFDRDFVYSFSSDYSLLKMMEKVFT